MIDETSNNRVSFDNLSWTCYEKLATDEVKKQNNKLVIYPNPVKNELFVVSNDKLSNFSIFNTAGNLLYHNKFVKNSVDVTKLTTGVYFIKIVAECQAGIIGNF